jgi:hypothetical protein
MRVAPLLAFAAVFPVLTACLSGGSSGAERRYAGAGSSDEPSQARAVLADGQVEYELTAWHLANGTHVDTAVRNHGPGVLRLDPSRATLVTAGGDPVAATPSGCGVCPPGAPCPKAASATAVREIPAGETLRVSRCFAPVNPWAGRHGTSGADPSRLALTWRDEGLARDGTPLIVVIELARR